MLFCSRKTRMADRRENPERIILSIPSAPRSRFRKCEPTQRQWRPDDTEATRDQLETKFGEEITVLVEGVSKLGKIKYRGVARHAENLRKMLLAMAQDFRVVLIKLADRYHNLQTLDALPAAKQKRIALESLEIYAPLAFRFGVSEFSKKIEDLAFKYCYPQEYNMILGKVQEQYPEREKYLDEIKPYVQSELRKESIRPIEIQTREALLVALRKTEKIQHELGRDL